MIISADENIRDFVNGDVLFDESLYPEEIRLRLNLSRNGLSFIVRKENHYIRYCAITLKDSLKMISACIKIILDRSSDDIEDVSSKLIVNIFRLIYEKSLMTGDCDISQEFPIIKFMLDNNIRHTEYEEMQIPFWTFNLQQNIFALKLHDKEKEFLLSNSKIDDLNRDHQEKVKDWKITIDEWNRKLDGYRQSVEKMTSQYNFFGLAKAFKNLIDGKNKELFLSKLYLKAMALVVLLPLFFSIYLSYLIWMDANSGVDPMRNKILFGIPVLIPLEVILIYFFRIILKEQLSLKAQILQLEMRYSVCAFIEEYAKFSKDIDKEKLSKFESLIFSGITPDPTAIPGTFDGMEQLASLVQKFQK